MLKRLIVLVVLALTPVGAAFALPDAPAGTSAYNVTGALFDTITKSTASVQTLKTQGILAYSVAFHDDKYQYNLPICADASLVEVNGATIDPNAFILGDTLVVSVRPNAAGDAKACINRVVRQKISRGASGGECLQEFQVKHEIDGRPSRLIIKQEYSYLLTIYARPTLDCDAKAYGSSPITTVVAQNKPFVVTLTRDTPSGTKELMRWSLSTDASGRASFPYTFAVPSASYKFQVTPGGNATPGDAIGWDANAIDPNPSPSPLPAAIAATSRFPTTPVIGLLALVLLGAGVMEYWRWVKKKREHELPEEEYRRTPRL